MDVPVVEIKLHPKANVFLFEYYATLRTVFSNVLGQVETDYMSIALVNQLGQLFFLSSRPSIEQNLIDKELWRFDGSYQADFIYQDSLKLWSELYHPRYANLLKQYKQVNQGLKTGLSIPTEYGQYRAVFLFGFKSHNPLVIQKAIKQSDKLLAMGKYCLREIKRIIPFPDQRKDLNPKPKLKLIINNR